MKRTSTVRTPGCLLRGACAAVVAGCCLLTPALSLAAPASAAADSRAAGASAVADGSALLADAQVISLGKVSASVPADWDSIQLGDSMVVSSSPDGLVKAAMLAVEADGVPGPDDANFETYFAAQAESDAAGMGADLVGSGVGTLMDGSKAFAAVIDATKTDEGVVMYGFYVPTEAGKLTTLVVTVDSKAVADNEDLVEAIGDSISRSGTASTAAVSASSAKLDEDVSAGDITFSIPDGMVSTDEDGTVMWANEDGYVVAVIPDVTDGTETYDSDDLELIAQMVALMFDGESWGSTTVEVDGTSVSLCAFVCATDDDEPILGMIALVPTPDGGVTALLAMCPANVADVYGGVMDAMVESVAVE